MTSTLMQRDRTSLSVCVHSHAVYKYVSFIMVVNINSDLKKPGNKCSLNLYITSTQGRINSSFTHFYSCIDNATIKVML